MSSEYQIQVSIKSAAGSFVILDVSPDKTIAQVKSLVQEKDATIDTSNLIYQQEPLDDSKTLADYNITDNSDLYFASPSASDNKSEVSTNENTTTQTPVKKSRKRCSFKSCNSAPLRGVGDCGFCEGHFCSKHRLLEQHDCIGLHNCKQQMHDRNASKLQDQQTVANKV